MYAAIGAPICGIIHVGSALMLSVLVRKGLTIKKVLIKSGKIARINSSTYKTVHNYTDRSLSDGEYLCMFGWTKNDTCYANKFYSLRDRNYESVFQEAFKERFGINYKVSKRILVSIMGLSCILVVFGIFVMKQVKEAEFQEWEIDFGDAFVANIGMKWQPDFDGLESYTCYLVNNFDYDSLSSEQLTTLRNHPMLTENGAELLDGILSRRREDEKETVKNHVGPSDKTIEKTDEKETVKDHAGPSDDHIIEKTAEDHVIPSDRVDEKTDGDVNVTINFISQKNEPQDNGNPVSIAIVTSLMTTVTLALLNILLNKSS